MSDTLSFTMPRERAFSVDAARAFLTRVYGYMAAGLALTAGASAAILSSPSLMTLLYGTPGILMVLMIAELALVIAFSVRVHKASTVESVAMLTTYALLNGVTLSGIFLVYTAASISSTFVVTAGMFGVMSLYGALTRTDLTSVRSFAMMAVFGIILASLVNLFVQSSALMFGISVIGVLAFTLLSAYDAQRILRMAQAGMVSTRDALRGALSLYLDFINIFLSLLRLMGDRR